MDLKEYLNKVLYEDKPIGEKNKVLWLSYLREKYFENNDDLYITFVSEDNVDPIVFGDEIEKVESDGAIVFNLDGKTVKKYFACNKLYLKESIKSNKVPEIVRKVLEQFL